ncbi:MAG: NAD(P)-binding domain-containing protein, partial [Actinomycetota bacterium]|nr:NAD(P)-binding domain-containing protein [Actinomycetota bacterium]
MANISVIGIGRIGPQLVARLMSAGHTVTGFDVNEERHSVLERSGARSAPDLGAAVSLSDVVFTAVTGTPEILELATHGQLLALMAPGAIWVDLTST